MPADRRHLSEWLEYIERVHPRSIEMGLERVNAVKDALGLVPRFPIVTVGGTNGKGSACAMLESMLHHAGYKVGCYTSPHLVRFNERVRIACAEAGDRPLEDAFAQVERARGSTPLTYFEFSTLAAMVLFTREKIDVAVLEVGLGGRLDAVNAFDADCSMVMSVDLDHMDYLGATREAIGYEKAGIYRPRRPAICGDSDPPSSLLEHARQIGAELLVAGRDFGYEAAPNQWRYWGPRGERHGLPLPALRGDYQIANAAAVLAALDTLHERLPVSANAVRTALASVENPGRFQVLPGRPAVILDVAHNPAAARALARNLARMPTSGRTYAVFAMLADKDIAGVVEAMKPFIDAWLVSGIDAPRGARAQTLVEALARAGATSDVHAFASPFDAYAQACDQATENDRIVVFGSFYTVAAVLATIRRRDKNERR